MHWLTKWRREYVCRDGRKGISKEELAKLVRNRDTGCSAVLIGIVESGGVTHPEIAKRIANATGCTCEQYNSMVHKIHHGGYVPNAPRKYSEFKPQKKPQPLTPGVVPKNAREVVCIDIAGNVISRHPSKMEAAGKYGCSVSAVVNRCQHRISKQTSEFKLLDRITFRFADEWDGLSWEERMSRLQFGKGH